MLTMPYTYKHRCGRSNTYLIMFVHQCLLEKGEGNQSSLQTLVERLKHTLSPCCSQARHQSSQCTPAARRT